MAPFHCSTIMPRINIPSPDNIDLSEWKYLQVIVMDGNFKAEHMAIKNTRNEFWLMDGHRYMVGSQRYKTYLAGAKPTVTVGYMTFLQFVTYTAKRSDCNNHCAVNQANASRGHLASTRIGGCACTRHRYFIPHAMVDFQKGEQQINMDYALIHAVQHQMQPTQCVINFYDINCQSCTSSHINPARNPYQPGIGIWHVHGNVDGEIMETLWSSLNIVSLSMWGMATPHQQEMLNFQMNDSNFLKMIRMSGALTWKLQVVWEEQECRALCNRTHDLKVMDIFDVQLHKASGIKSVEMNLIEAQRQDDDLWGSATWIAQGLNIEEAQIALKLDASRIHLQAMENQRDKLQPCINGFLEYAGSFIRQGWNGLISGTISDQSQDFNEIFIEICLSDPEATGLPPSSHLGLDMSGLRAPDKSCLFCTDVRHSHNYNMTSHAWKKVSDVDAVVRRHAAMVSLGADASILDHYQVLKPHHLWVSTVVVDPNACGHHYDHLAWAKYWKDLELQVKLSSHCRFCCYAAQQGSMYHRLATL
ncbi:hypothetical protein V8B97DRAFT_2027071 [Scleroderma yunnanense]